LRILLVSLLFGLCAFAQAPLFHLPGEFDSLAQNEAAWRRYDSTFVRVKAEDRFDVERYLEIIVNHRDGAEAAYEVLFENEFIATDDYEVSLYQYGKHLELNDGRKIHLRMDEEKVRDIEDHEIIELQGDFAYYSYDNSRRTLLALDHDSYPYLVKIYTRQEFSSLFFWRGWSAQKDIPVQRAVYHLAVEDEIEFRWKFKGSDQQPLRWQMDGDDHFQWSFDYLAPRYRESFMRPDDRDQLRLYVAPEYFRLGPTRGSMASWQQMGSWIRKLYSGKTKLSEAMQMEVADAVSAAQSDREKIAILYKMLQDKTHYVNISPEMSGWIPAAAVDTWNDAHGECKALSNLMVAVLRSADVPAYPALASVRDNGYVDPDFPSSPFNHVITVVPMADDTLFLECTADYIYADEIPSGIASTNVLMFSDMESKLLRVPMPPAEVNFWHSRSEADVDAIGNISVATTLKLGGNQRYSVVSHFAASKEQDEKLFIERNIIGRYLKNVTVSDFTHDPVTPDKPYLQIEFTTRGNKSIQRAGSRLFIVPSLFNRITADTQPDEEERFYPVEFDYAYADQDTIIFSLPAAYELERRPADTELENEHLYFATKSVYTGKNLYYWRTFRQKSYQIPLADYAAYKALVDSMRQIDAAKFIFKHTR
jgi:hypothetical protein